MSLAFRLSPMVVQFTPTGAGTTQVLTLDNPGNDKIPVQIEVFSREENSKGEELRKKTEDFNIYPEQVVLLPKEKRNVRITWAGKIEAQEKSYRIIASQLPVEFRDRNAKPKKADVNLNFLLQYVASAYVTPEGATARVKVKDVNRLDRKKFSLSIYNEGSAHRMIRVKSLKIFSGDKLVVEIPYPKELEGINLLVGGSRNVVLNSPKEIPPTSLTGEIDLAETGD